MIDIQSIDLEDYRVCLKDRGYDLESLKDVIEKNKQRKQWLSRVEFQKAERNRISKAIAVKKQRKEDASEMILSMKLLGADIQESEKEFKKVEADYLDGLALLPNMCHESTPSWDFRDR